jgi:long-chain acyl-CoA synthetase
MALSYDEAAAEVCGPGQIFEVVDQMIAGVPMRCFKHAPENLGALFTSGRDSDEVFLVYEDERWTFRSVMEHVDALAASLVDRYGIKKGDRVAIAMRNLPEWIIAFAAAVSIGAISVSLNAWWTQEELEFAVNDCEPSIFVVDHERLDRLRKMAFEREIPVIVARADELEPLIGEVANFEEALFPGAPMPEIAVDAEDSATILYTSGTTGHPKGAVSSHRAVLQALFGFWANVSIQSLRKGDLVSDTDGYPPLFHLDRPALPCDRLRPGDALLLWDEAQAGDDAPLGTGVSAPSHRARARHHPRRRAHPELGPDRVPCLLAL